MPDLNNTAETHFVTKYTSAVSVLFMCVLYT